MAFPRTLSPAPIWGIVQGLGTAALLTVSVLVLVRAYSLQAILPSSPTRDHHAPSSPSIRSATPPLSSALHMSTQHEGGGKAPEDTRMRSVGPVSPPFSFPEPTGRASIKAAVLFLVRPTVVSNTDFITRLRELIMSCKFIIKYKIMILVSGDIVGQPLPHAVSTLELCNRLALPLGQSRCPVQVLDVTTIFWGGRPQNWRDLVFKAAPDSPGPSNDKYPGWARKTFSWGYRAMCDFWTRGVFQIPAIAQLDYFMRLDDDSYANCPNKSIDLFHEMHVRNAVYAFYKFAYDICPREEDWLSQYIMQTVNKTTGISPKARSRFPYKDRGPFHVPSFYNNFEIVKVKYFLGQRVQQFNDAVTASKGIWEYRWGDAVQRYAQLALFLSDADWQNRIWCVPTVRKQDKDAGANALFVYRHGRHTPDCQIGNGATRWGPRGT